MFLFSIIIITYFLYKVKYIDKIFNLKKKCYNKDIKLMTVQTHFANDIRNIVILTLVFVIIYGLVVYFDQQYEVLSKISDIIVPYFIVL